MPEVKNFIRSMILAWRLYWLGRRIRKWQKALAKIAAIQHLNRKDGHIWCGMSYTLAERENPHTKGDE